MAKATKMTEKTLEALNFLKAHGGKATTEEMREGLGCEKIASITGRVNSLVNKELAYREKVEEGETKLTYVILTDEGMNFVPADDED